MFFPPAVSGGKGRSWPANDPGAGIRRAPSGPELEIRAPRSTDAGSVLSLAEPLGWTPEQLQRELVERPEDARVAWRGGRPVAALITRRGPAELHVLALGVVAEVRRSGVARALLTDLIRRAIDGDEEAIHLEVREENHAAIALYEGLGFEIVGERARYYRDGSNAILMTLSLERIRR